MAAAHPRTLRREVSSLQSPLSPPVNGEYGELRETRGPPDRHTHTRKREMHAREREQHLSTPSTHNGSRLMTLELGLGRRLLAWAAQIGLRLPDAWWRFGHCPLLSAGGWAASLGRAGWAVTPGWAAGTCPSSPGRAATSATIGEREAPRFLSDTSCSPRGLTSTHPCGASQPEGSFGPLPSDR